MSRFSSMFDMPPEMRQPSPSNAHFDQQTQAESEGDVRGQRAMIARRRAVLARQSDVLDEVIRDLTMDLAQLVDARQSLRIGGKRAAIDVRNALSSLQYHAKRGRRCTKGL